MTNQDRKLNLMVERFALTKKARSVTFEPMTETWKFWCADEIMYKVTKKEFETMLECAITKLKGKNNASIKK